MTRVLVTYASKHGSTAEIAEAIAHELQHHGINADCMEADRVRDIAPYDAVVLGSAVYMRRWRRSARRFLRRYGQPLSALPWWAFSSGPVGDPGTTDAQAAGWLEPPGTMAQVERLGAREHVVFGGRVARDPHNFVERAMARNTPEAFADRRDWTEIAAWSARIASELGAGRERSAA